MRAEFSKHRHTLLIRVSLAAVHLYSLALLGFVALLAAPTQRQAGFPHSMLSFQQAHVLRTEIIKNALRGHKSREANN